MRTGEANKNTMKEATNTPQSGEEHFKAKRAQQTAPGAEWAQQRRWRLPALSARKVRGQLSIEPVRRIGSWCLGDLV